MGVSISLADANNPLLIIEKIIVLSERYRLILRFPKNDSSLRNRTLPILESRISTSRLQRRTRTITLMPNVEIDRSSIVTRAMMICPPLMVAGALGISSLSPSQPLLMLAGIVAGATLGMLIVTTKEDNRGKYQNKLLNPQTMREITLFWRRDRLLDTDIAPLLDIVSRAEFLAYIKRTPKDIRMLLKTNFHPGKGPEDLNSLYFLELIDIHHEPEIPTSLTF